MMETNEQLPASPDVSTPNRGRSGGRAIAWTVAGAVLVVGAVLYFLLVARGGDAASRHGADAGARYTCSMHPQVIRDEPGECPICHMELVPMRRAAMTDTTARQRSADTAGASVRLASDGRIIARIATVAAGYRRLDNTVSAPARVDFNETTHRVVAARYNGRIDHLFVRETGQFIHEGDPLMDIYSPDLVTAQSEYLAARDASRLRSAPLGSDHTLHDHGPDHAANIAAASRKRLELLGMSVEQIVALEQRHEITYSVRVYSPASGVVLKRSVVEGAYVNEGTTLIELVDLSTVWVLADVDESDVDRMKQGMPMLVSAPTLGGEPRRGRIAYIYPTADGAARTVRVRGLFANPGLRLRPGMYLTATLRVESRDVLAVPVDAVVRTGRRDLVYVEVAPDTFVPREVRIGLRDGEYYEIAGGAINAGDKVVAEGGFLVDSETRLTSVGDEHERMRMTETEGRK